MRAIDYFSKFDKIPDVTKIIFLNDTELSEKVQNWRQDYMKLFLRLHKNDYKHKLPNSIIIRMF